MTPYHLSRLACVATCFILGLASTAWADNFNFIPIDVPGATDTQALGINDRGQIVGSFSDGAFLLDNGHFTILPDVFLSPGVRGHLLTAADINNRGEIVGTLIVSGSGIPGGPTNAYLREPDGTVTRIAGSFGPRHSNGEGVWHQRPRASSGRCGSPLPY